MLNYLNNKILNNAAIFLMLHIFYLSNFNAKHFITICIDMWAFKFFTYPGKCRHKTCGGNYPFRCVFTRLY